MQFDTDVLIWVFRGNTKAADAIDKAEERRVSVISYMELLQGARDKTETRDIKAFLSDLAFEMLPLTENIGHRASIYMEEYGLKTAMCAGDAIVAATAVENQLQLLSGNRKHYKVINKLDLKVFKP
jgi:predicted nucleic acid-binding protein